MNSNNVMQFMTMPHEPDHRKDWNSIRRECALIQGLISVGIVSLQSATYMDGEGYYYSAFFSLSTGIERLAKLILVADHIIEHKDDLPSKDAIKKYGHDLIKLLDEVDKITTKYELESVLKYSRPRDDISTAIISCLASFADADKGRYANFNTLGDPNFEPALEPIKKWWREVAESILTEHYYGTEVEQKIKRDAIAHPERARENDTFYYTDETGKIINSAQGFIERDSQTEFVQKYGYYYTLRIARWMAEVFCKFSDNKQGSDALSNHSKYFNSFIRSDEELKSRWQAS